MPEPDMTLLLRAPDQGRVRLCQQVYGRHPRTGQPRICNRRYHHLDKHCDHSGCNVLGCQEDE
jgi:hypothetical protein